MEPTRAASVEHRAFLTDPQHCGVWSLRIEFSEKHFSALVRGLHLDNSMYKSRRGYPPPGPGGSRQPRSAMDDRPAVLIPRLFAYLRATVPHRERAGLSDLSQTKQQGRVNSRRFPSYRRAYSFYDDLLTPPPHLGSAKKRAMAGAAALYRESFLHCRFSPVPDNFVRIDVISRQPLLYFQVAEELPSSIRILSPCEETLVLLQRLLEKFAGDGYVGELTKVFSPENLLMEMYLPILRLTPLSTLLKDRIAARNVAQSLDEADEERFVHSIRAIGIAAEELLVEIFET